MKVEPASPEPMNQDIAAFYDATSAMWERVWGPHMHHGFYGHDGRKSVDPKMAQLDMVDELLRFAGVTEARAILDSGCGIGGSTLYLYDRLNAEKAVGLTLSPRQVVRARKRAALMDLSDSVTFSVDDATSPDLPEASFDLIWSLECLEHITHKAEYFYSARRLLRPGGRIVVAFWARRESPPELGAHEQAVIDSIAAEYHLPGLETLSQVERHVAEAGFSDIATADWTAAVAPFWGDVIRSAATPRGVFELMRTGTTAIRAALAMRHMRKGFRLGLVRFGVISAVSPES